eukprot:TRINITY_DN38760_c0_g1_i2.p1 TRINITY_DN38760_c0_g1~~TRINITY_DN38760_c0_g1_i2.p1  ORF type:complete len:165 (+),score=31.69 TRINITY_DN38760_c0_g1_i2:55-549(+)
MCTELPIRPLEVTDYDKGFLDLMAQLTEVGSIGKSDFEAQFARRTASGVATVVVEEEGKIIGTGSILFEEKFTRSCGTVGHIEDIVVCKSKRGTKLGARIMKALQDEAVARGCYKIILDCADANQGFYEKQGFKRKEVQMRYDVPEELRAPKRSRNVNADRKAA